MVDEGNLFSGAGRGCCCAGRDIIVVSHSVQGTDVQTYCTDVQTYRRTDVRTKSLKMTVCADRGQIANTCGAVIFNYCNVNMNYVLPVS